MVLLLATHRTDPSASVPLPMIVLLDAIQAKLLPHDLRPRMVRRPGTLVRGQLC